MSFDDPMNPGPSSSQPTPQPKTRATRKTSPLLVVLLVSAAFFAIFVFLSSAIFFWKSSSSGFGNKRGAPMALLGGGSGAVGVIELNGVIMDSKKILKRLESFEESKMIRAVVLRLNSPGGAVAPSQEIYQAVKAYKKPIVVSMGSVAASGAYYVAMGAQKVFANPGTITGSIGVIMEFANLEKLYDWAKIHRYSIKTGRFKDVGAEYRPMSDDERALLQGMVNDVLTQFKQAVADGRKMKMSEVDAVADGRIFSGQQAKKAKLVDELGTLQDAIDEAAKLAGITGKPDVVYPERSRPRWLDFILDNDKEDSSESSQSLVQQIVSSITKSLTGSAGVAALEPGVYWIWGGAR